jgi:hypothetical protein
LNEEGVAFYGGAVLEGPVDGWADLGILRRTLRWILRWTFYHNVHRGELQALRVGEELVF